MTLLWPAPAADPFRDAIVGACRGLADRLRGSRCRRRGRRRRGHAPRVLRDAVPARRPGNGGPGDPADGRRAAVAGPRREGDRFPGRRDRRPGGRARLRDGARPLRGAAGRNGAIAGRPARRRRDARGTRSPRSRRTRCATATASITASALDPCFRAAGGQLRRLADRRQRRDRGGGRAAQLARSAARAPADGHRRTCSPSPASARPRTSIVTRPGCTTACGARPRSAGAVLVADLVPGGARVLGRARDALGAALQRAEHRPERRARGCSARSSASSSARCIVLAVGTNTTVLWVLLPPAILVTGVAPAAISFAAGQAAFTVTALILFDLLAPGGLETGLIRVEDVALGGAVSLVVGLLLWPRGAVQRPRHGARRGVRRCGGVPRRCDPPGR